VSFLFNCMLESFGEKCSFKKRHVFRFRSRPNSFYSFYKFHISTDSGSGSCLLSVWIFLTLLKKNTFSFYHHHYHYYYYYLGGGIGILVGGGRPLCHP
jgi:hypothetical protein